jgi:hypothetical protein
MRSDGGGWLLGLLMLVITPFIAVYHWIQARSFSDWLLFAVFLFAWNINNHLARIAYETERARKGIEYYGNIAEKQLGQIMGTNPLSSEPTGRHGSRYLETVRNEGQRTFPCPQ